MSVLWKVSNFKTKETVCFYSRQLDAQDEEEGSSDTQTDENEAEEQE